MTSKLLHAIGGAVAGLLLAGFAFLGVSPVETAPAAGPIGTNFTYQGQLIQAGVPANANFDFQFRLYDDAAAGSQVGATLTHANVAVFNGLFNVKLDFGNVMGAAARWLDIGVRLAGSADPYTILSPRQELTPSPYALALPNVYTNEGQSFTGIGRNFRISSNEVFGIRYSGAANAYGGMYVETQHANGWPFYGFATNGSFRAWTYYNGSTSAWHLYNAGIRLTVPSSGGLIIGPSADYSLVITNTTGSDGIRVLKTADDGIQIGSGTDVPNYGVYIPSPGVVNYALWPNTAQAAGEWALFTVDKISAGNVAASTYSLLAQVDGPDSLTPGDVVAAAGMADALAGSLQDLPLVRLADGGAYNGIIGVVESRMVYGPAPGKEAEGEMSLHSAEGPAKAGDYVMLVVYGVTQVKVDANATLDAGQRLTAASVAGSVRALDSRTLDGMTISESAPVIGIALAAPLPGQATIPVFVTLR